MQNLLKMTHEKSGQAAMVGVMISLIVTLLIGVIVINQLFLSGAAPYQSDNKDAPGYGTPEAVAAANQTKMYAWVGIGLMALGVIILAAVTILTIVRGGLGGVGGRGI
jgi:hypothetical protein